VQLLETVITSKHAEALYESVNIIGDSSVQPTLGKDNDAIHLVANTVTVGKLDGPDPSQNPDPRQRSDPARQPVLMIDSVSQSSNVRTPADERG